MDESSSPLKFIFKAPDATHFDALRQGDLLLRTTRVKEALAQAHQHYANHAEYTHFVVLTQSCDLAARDGGKFRASYITICAAKPLSAYLDKKFADVFAETSPIKIGRSPMLRGAEGILKKLISNTSDEVFFLDAFAAPSINEPLCAFLQLSIALRAEHYDALVAAKQAEMTDIFAAKIGWMTGNLYSRVATPDLYEIDPGAAEDYERNLIQSLLRDNTEWLGTRQIKEYRRRLSQASDARDEPLSTDEAHSIVRECPKPIQELSGAVLDVLAAADVAIEPNTLKAIQNRIESNQKLRGFASRIA